MKRTKHGAFLIAHIVVVLVIAVWLASLSGCATTQCHCTTDTECAEKCGGFGDPEPRR